MSVVPLMSAAMPTPEPPPVTWTFLPALAFMYSSAQRWARMTIVSEPLTVTAALARNGTAARARAKRKRFMVFVLLVR